MEPIPSPILSFFEFSNLAKPLFLVHGVNQAVPGPTRLAKCLSPTVMSVCRPRATACNFMLALEQATISIKPVLDAFHDLEASELLAERT